MSSTNNYNNTHHLHNNQTYDNGNILSGPYHKFKSDKEQSRSNNSSKSKGYSAYTKNGKATSSSDSEQDSPHQNNATQINSSLVQKNLLKNGMNKFTTQQFKIERDSQKKYALRYGNGQILNNQNVMSSKDGGRGGTQHHSRKPSTNGNSAHVKKTYPVAPSANYLNLHAANNNNSPRHKKNLSSNSMFTSYYQNSLHVAGSRNNRPLEKGNTLDNTQQNDERGGQINQGDDQMIKNVLRKSDGLSSMKKQVGTYMYGRPQSSRPNRNLKKPLLSGNNTQDSRQAPPLTAASASFNHGRLKKNSSRVITNQASPDKRNQPQMELQPNLLQKQEHTQNLLNQDLEEDKGRLQSNLADARIHKHPQPVKIQQFHSVQSQQRYGKEIYNKPNSSPQRNGFKQANFKLLKKNPSYTLKNNGSMRNNHGGVQFTPNSYISTNKNQHADLRSKINNFMHEEKKQTIISSNQHHLRNHSLQISQKSPYSQQQHVFYQNPSSHVRHSSAPIQHEDIVIPQNVVTRFSYSTKAGFVPKNPYKVNQDQYVVTPKILGKKYIHLFGICDGHGHLGRQASYTTKVRLISNLQNELRFYMGGGSLTAPLSYTDLKKGIKRAYLNTNKDVVNAAFDTQFRQALKLFHLMLSGTTCCNVIFAGRKGLCANVGDSRAIIGTFSQNGYVERPFSRDHKPSEKDQANRVLRSGGRIQQYRDPFTNQLLGPLRVWVKTEQYPGLAMTRSIGDQVAKKVGVSAEAQIFEQEFTCDDKFVIIGSDGIWEFMSNQEAVDIVAPFFQKNNAEGAAQSLVRDALRRWRSRQDVVDDITCVILFLDVPPAEPKKGNEDQQLDNKRLHKLNQPEKE